MDNKRERDRINGHIAQRAWTIVRAAHKDEFDAIYAEVRPQWPHQSGAYRKASMHLMKRYPAEYAAAREAVREQVGVEKRVGRKPVNLTKKVQKGPRSYIDPMDALILHERGLTVKQIAEQDGCSQAAVLRALVPILARRRSPFAGWWEPDKRMKAHDVAALLGSRSDEIARLMA